MRSIIILADDDEPLGTSHAFCAYEPEGLSYIPCMVSHNFRFDRGMLKY